MSATEAKARDLFAVLSEANVMNDLPTRKRLAVALAEEDMPVAELRRRVQRLSRVDEWVRILVRRKQDNGATNTTTDTERQYTAMADENYVIERVNVDGKSAEFVAQQMAWPLSRVEEVLERATT